jgi:hypothetical protein
MKHRVFHAAAILLALSPLACGSGPADLGGLSSFQITILQVNGAAPPPIDAPLPANIGTTDEEWQFEVQAMDPFGAPVDFDGFARIKVEPGAVTAVTGEGSVGRNIHFVDGKSAGTASVTAVYGPSRLWVEDVGYVPVDPDAPPRCADGLDDDDDGLIDYPSDPGCAFADDDSEEPGSFAAGVSPPVHYALPRIVDIQGTGTETPYAFEGIQVNTHAGRRVIVTRVSSDGFYATDIDGPPDSSNSIFAFNFSTPAGMRVCDQLVYLSGTISEFFGFTELSFPSYDVTFVKEGEGVCEVPAPALVDPTVVNDPVKMETLESALVRIEGYHIAGNFGPGRPLNANGQLTNNFQPEVSNCDLNLDGQVDFENKDEASCSNACAASAECSEWTGYSARGNYKVSKGGGSCSTGNCIQIQTSSIADFDPPSHKGETLTAVTGTMRNFSGGSLNWTIETRCPDDLVCSFAEACSDKILPSTEACVRLRTTDDPDEGTN